MDMSPYRECTLCPRMCRVDRTAGQRGVCGETAECRVASIGPHHGEEPSLSGQRGSGTIFFAGCPCRCFFCQNWQISREGHGEQVDFPELIRRAEELVARGVHNLNFVTPEHVWPHVRALCSQLRQHGIEIPFVWNSSGYMHPELVPDYADIMDIFLPDFKFADPDLASRCMGDAQYPDLCLAALIRMVAAVGFLEPWDEAFVATARRGVLVRHLVLPGHVDNSLAVIRLLHERFGPQLPMSVMSQYRPTRACEDKGEFCRQVTPTEYQDVCDLVEELEFEHVYIQPASGDAAFLPDFSEDEPFEGNRRMGE